MPATTCPHCGAENPASPVVTLCGACGEPLGEAVAPPEPAPRCVHETIPPPVAPVFPPWTPESAVPATPTPEEEPPPPAAPLSPAGFTIPIPRHAGLFVALPPISCFLGLAFFMVLAGTERLDAVPLGQFGQSVLFFALPLGGIQLPRLLLMRVVQGRCPNCSGPARVRGTRPLTYECRACGHVERTSTSEGNYSAGVRS